MSSISTNNRRIAKNTLLLYVRMLFLMLVNLYTSRVILRILGVDDYGIYNAVGGIVLMLSFLNSALSNGSSRFITYELGKKDSSCLNIIFCTILNAHLLLAIIVVLIAETVGLWFVTNKLGLAADRLNAALLAYHFSVLTSVATITQVPYTATIIAHERMQIYAYASIFEVVLKLLILYLLPILGHDRLETYAVLLFIVQIIIISIYRVYSIRKFSETKYKFIFNKKKFQEITSFSSWSLLGNAAHALTGQGTNILLQMFFGPKLVAARAISLQVNMAANQFVNNFKLAADPQIVKYYAAGDVGTSKRLTLNTAKFSFFLMLFLCLPIYVVADPLLKLWLVIVPPYTLIFLKLIILQSLFSVFDTCFYSGLYACGRVKENALISPFILSLQFPVIYIAFKLGGSPVFLSYAGIMATLILAIIVKPLLLVKLAGYNWDDIKTVFIPCCKTAIAAFIPSLFVAHFLSKDYWQYAVLLVIVPPYTLIFLKLIILQSLFSVFDTCFYSGLYACGRVKENALISPFILSLQFPVIYIAFKLGGSPVFLSYAGIMATLILAIIVKPLLLVKLAGYNWDDIKTVFIPCCKTAIAAFIPSLFVAHFLSKDYWQYAVLLVIVMAIVIFCILYIGIRGDQRIEILNLIKNKILRK